MKLYVMQGTPDRSYAGHLEAAVEEVFRTRMGVRCTLLDVSGHTRREESYGAVVGFAGSMRGSCVVRVDHASGLLLAELLAGAEPSDEGTIEDGVAEVCSLVAGRWKGAIRNLASGCVLSPPMVIAGYDFRLHSQPMALQIHRRLGFASVAEMEVILQGDLED